MAEWETEQKTEGDATTGEGDQDAEDSKMNNGADEAEEGEGEAFQTMSEGGPQKVASLGAEAEGRKKIRSVPVMTVYMSRVPVSELKQAYGYVDWVRHCNWNLLTIQLSEQTNS